MQQKTPFYQSTWFTILTLIFPTPVGLFCMWYYKKFNKIARIVITCVLALFYSIAFLVPDEDTKEVSLQESTTDIITTTEITTTETTTIETTIESTTEDLTQKKQAAREKDKKIWNIILLAEDNVNLIQGGANLVSTGEADYSDLYALATQSKTNHENYLKNLNDLKDEDCADYIQSAIEYINNTKSVADNVIKFIDKNDEKYLQNSIDSIDNMANYTLQVIGKRFEYLSNVGFSDEEIQNIASSNESTN